VNKNTSLGSLARQSGFSLIEGMIAAVMLAIGVLALTGMQAISFSRNTDANELTRATSLATDMVERIQYSRKIAPAGFTPGLMVYDGINVSAVGNCAIAGGQVMPSGDCNQWRALLLASGLNNVQGQVQVVALNPTILNQVQVNVQVSWQNTVGNAGVNKNISITMSTVIAPE
jgi:type IV pilus assembly protein PilV